MAYRPFPARLTLAAALTLCHAPVWHVTALAQSATQSAAHAVQHRYDIPAGPLADALTRFAQISGSFIAATPEMVAGKSSAGLVGDFGVQEALDRLLADTGLQAQRGPGGQFVLHVLPAAPSADLSPVITTLAPISVVSAAGHEQEIRHAPASISVITSSELEQRQFTSLQDMVRDVPGVAVIGAGQQSGISIRGMEKDYTLVLVDGMRVRSETGNPRQLNDEDLDSHYIPPLASIERIEVIRGPMSALYGSDAVGGIINVITKKTPERWSGHAEAGLRRPDAGNMGDQRQRNAHVSGPLVPNLLGLSVWGNETRQDADDYNGGYQASTKRTIGGKLRLTPNADHDITLNYSDASQRYTNSRGDREWTREHWALAWDARFDAGNLELKYHQEDYERLTYPRNATGATGSTNRVADARFLTWLGAHTVTIGGQWTHDRLTNNDLGPIGNNIYGTRKTSERAVFAEDEWALVDDTLFLTTGLRATRNDRFGSHTTPRAYLVYTPAERWTFKGGVATGYKRPKITQIDASTASRRGGGANQFSIVGNPRLKPETSTNVEVSARYAHDEDFSAGVTLFHTDFDNKIISTNGYFFDDGMGGRLAAFCNSGAVGSRNCPGWATWLNLDGAKNRGVELDARWQINPIFSLKGNYTYTQSRISLGGDTTINTPAGPRRFGQTLAHLDGNSLAGIPKHNGALTLDWRANSALSGFVRVNYEGQLTRVSFENQTVDKNDKDLMTLDAGLTYAVTKHFSLVVTVDNLTDAKRFKVDQTTGAYRYAERGRSYYASLRGRF